MLIFKQAHGEPEKYLFFVLGPNAKRWLGIFVSMDDPQCVAIVWITPRTKRVTISEHDQLLGFDFSIFEVLEYAVKIGATTAL